MRNMDLAEAASETFKIIESGFYINNMRQQVSIQEETRSAVSNSESIRPEDFPELFELKRNDTETRIEVTGETTLEAAKRICYCSKRSLCF